MVGLTNVDDTSDANKPVSSATQTALNLKANLAGPTFTGTVSGITKAMVGLTNVDDTSDANKPVSSATQTALNLKANIADPSFTGIPVAPTAAAGTGTTQIATTAFVTTGLNLKANLADPTFTGTVSGITKAMVGLTNVDDTSDANKPVSSATQTALNLKANIADPTFTGTVSAASISTTGTITGNSYQSSGTGIDISFGPNITTGSIHIGAAQTDGDINLGNGTVRTAAGNIYIGTGSTAGGINIGRSNVVSIVNSATPTLTINRPINLTTGSAAIQTSGVNSLGYFYTKVTNTINTIATGTSYQSSALTLTGSGVFIINFSCTMSVGTTISTTVRITGVTLTSSTTNVEGNTILGSCYKDDNTISLQSGDYIRSGSIIVRQTANQSYYALYRANFSSGTITSMNFSIEGVKIA
jgi:hypothetical protein